MQHAPMCAKLAGQVSNRNTDKVWLVQIWTKNAWQWCTRTTPRTMTASTELRNIIISSYLRSDDLNTKLGIRSKPTTTTVRACMHAWPIHDGQTGNVGATSSCSPATEPDHVLKHSDATLRGGRA